MPSDAKSAVSDTVADVLATFPVRLGILFGSTVRGTAGEHSDVDVAVEFDSTLSNRERDRNRLQLIVALSKAFQTDDIDVTDLDGMRPEIGVSAIEHGIVVIGDPDRAARLKRGFEDRLTPRSAADRRRQFDAAISRMEHAVDA